MLLKRLLELLRLNYRKHPIPVVLRTIMKPLDCYLVANGKMSLEESAEDITTYFVFHYLFYSIVYNHFKCLQNNFTLRQIPFYTILLMKNLHILSTEDQ